MLEKILDWLKMFQFKRYFMSIVVSVSDSKILRDKLKELPVDVSCMGFAIGVPFTMKFVEASSKEKDEIPYVIFYVVVKKAEWFPWFVKRQIVQTLKDNLKFRWSYGTDMEFD